MLNKIQNIIIYLNIYFLLIKYYNKKNKKKYNFIIYKFYNIYKNKYKKNKKIKKNIK